MACERGARGCPFLGVLPRRLRRLGKARRWRGKVEMLPLQQVLHGGDRLLVTALLAIDAGADPRHVARTVGILAAARTVAVVIGQQLIATLLEVLLGRRLRQRRMDCGRRENDREHWG